MALFTRKKDSGVNSFVIALLNQNCPALRDQFEGPRVEGRVNLTKVVMVVPILGDKFIIRQAFTATTKEFSSAGVAVVVDHPYGPDEAVLGFHWKGSIVWMRGRAKHVHPMGGGFFQVGFRLTERLEMSDHPDLARIVF
jgi:hypothetical protein